MADEVGGVKAKIGMDTVQFQQGVKLLETKMKLVGQEFKNASGGLDKVTDASKISALKVNELTNKLELQREYVKNLNTAHDKMSETLAAGSQKLLAHELKLKQSEGALQDLERALKQATTEIIDESQALDKSGDEAAQTDKQTEGLTKSTHGLQSAMNGVGKGLKLAAIGVAAVATASVAAAAAIGRMVSSATENAGELQKMSDVTGFTAEKIQELAYVGKAIDLEFETLIKSQTKLTQGMSLAASGGKKQAEAFKTLGVDIKGADGKLRDAKIVMLETIDALGSMKNETERDAMSLKIFGKSAMELNPLIKAGSKEIARLSEEARSTGAVMSNEAVAGLDNFGDSVEALKMSLQGIAGSVATALLPALNGTIGFAKSLIPSLQNAIKTGDFFEFGLDLGYGIESGIKSLSIGMEKFIPVVTQILTSLVNAIVIAIPVILPLLIQAVMALINAFVGILKTNGPALIDAGIDAIMTLVMGMVEAMPMIIDMAITLIMALANGLLENLPKLVSAAVDIILALVDGIIILLPELIPVAIEMIVALVNGLIEALPRIIEAIPTLIQTIIDAIVNNLPMLIDASIAIIVALVQALIENYPLLIKSAWEIVTALAGGIIKAMGQLMTVVPKLFTALKEAFKKIKWGELGKNLIDGVIEGVVKAAAGIADAVVKAAKAALKSVKEFLGIRSPSTVMEVEVGGMMGQGMASGIDKSKGALTKAMQNVTNVMIQQPREMNLGMQISNALSGFSPEVKINAPSGSQVDLSSLKSTIKDAMAGVVLVIDIGGVEFRRATIGALNSHSIRSGGVA